MYFLIKVFDKNKNIIIESDKVYTYDLHKFMEFTKFCKTEFTIEIKNILEYYEKNNTDSSTQTNNVNINVNDNVNINVNDDVNHDVIEDDYVDEDEEYISNSLFEGMFIEKYGRGYILKCNEEHKDYGEKYYHKGWWFPKQKAWFFKEEFLEYYLDRGALFWEDIETN